MPPVRRVSWASALHHWIASLTGSPGLIPAASFCLVAMALPAQGFGPALDGLVVGVVGTSLAALGLGTDSFQEALGASSRRLWLRTLVGGFFLALVAEVSFLAAGGRGFEAAGLLFLSAWLWAASAFLSNGRNHRLFLMAPVTVLVALVLTMLLGHRAGAGLIYYLGPLPAYILVLAGHMAVNQTWTAQAGAREPVRWAHTAAAAVIAVLAWVDLS